MLATTFAEEALHRNEKCAKLTLELCSTLKDEPVIQIVTSLPGIGLWTATCLRLEFGRFERFPSAAAVVAYGGPNPPGFESGDGGTRIGISRRGRSTIRAPPYMAVLPAIRGHPPIAACSW